MYRTSFLLPIALRNKAKFVAKRYGITLSELIRRQLAACVRDSKVSGRNADPLFHPGKLMARGGPSGTDARHDDYLYGPARAAKGLPAPVRALSAS